MKTKTCALLAGLLLLHTAGLAQQQFTEGTILYHIRIDQAPGNTTTPGQLMEGDFQITLKGRQLIKELRLSSGFSNLLIFNMTDNTAYSLRRVQNRKYAIQLDAADLNRKQRACEKMVIQDLPADHKMIGGYKALRSNISCGKTDPIQLYYTKDWELAENNLFQYFPDFRYLPLAYDIKSEDGSVLHFELQRIESKPVDNGAFRIPSDYKVISNAEYQQMSGKR
jgi:hypothetical protein